MVSLPPEELAAGLSRPAFFSSHASMEASPFLENRPQRRHRALLQLSWTFLLELQSMASTRASMASSLWTLYCSGSPCDMIEHFQKPYED